MSSIAGQEQRLRQAEQQPEEKNDQGVFAGYTEEEFPLAAYAGLVGTYNAAFAALLLAAKNAGRPLPERAKLGDILLLGVATHKLSRIVAKDWVTSPFRAPFAEYIGPASGGEVKEKARGSGLRRAVGDLVTCPWCVAPWVAAALTFGFVFRPRAARLVGTIFSAVAISDFLQHAYEAVKKKH